MCGDGGARHNEGPGVNSSRAQCARDCSRSLVDPVLTFLGRGGGVWSASYGDVPVVERTLGRSRRVGSSVLSRMRG